MCFGSQSGHQAALLGLRVADGGSDLLDRNIAASGGDRDLRPTPVDRERHCVLRRQHRGGAGEQVRHGATVALSVYLRSDPGQELQVDRALLRPKFVWARTDTRESPGDRPTPALDFGFACRAAKSRNRTSQSDKVDIAPDTGQRDVARSRADQTSSGHVLEVDIATGCLNDKRSVKFFHFNIALFCIDEDRTNVTRHPDRHIAARIVDMDAFAAIERRWNGKLSSR